MSDDFNPQLQFTDNEKLANWLSLTMRGRDVMNMVLSPLIPPTHKKRLPRFTSTESVGHWLQLTNEGRELLDAILPAWMLRDTKAMEIELRAEVDRRLQGRASVLVVCHEGYLEAYSDEATIHFANALAGVDDMTADAATDAGEYLEWRIPERYRRLLFCRPQVHSIENFTAEEELRRRTELALVRELKAIGEGR